MYDRITTWKEGDIIDCREAILESHKFIEKQLEEKILVSEIAHEFGYSKYYFSREFSKYTGISVMEYVKRRRLLRAAEDINRGMKVIDAAIKYSYNSHSSFTKAFKKEFGYTPSLLSAFKMQINDLKGGNHMSKRSIRKINQHENTDNLFSILLDTMKANGINCDIARVIEVYEVSKKAYKGIQRYSGDEYIIHPLNVAIILSDIGASENVIIAGLMCDILKKTNLSIVELEEYVSKDVLATLKDVADYDFNREILNEDVMLVKLAERLHNMRTLKFMDESKWRNKSKETIEIYIPVARKIGNIALLEELNQLAIEYM